jgi:protein SERAC1
MDILFIHGLTGDPQSTWTSAGPQREYWPDWFCDEFSNVAVYTLGYPASILEKWAKQEMNLHERANNMLEQLASFGIGERPVAVVTHSLGGILAKEMLRASNECTDAAWKLIADNTRLVAFLATPHTGAALGAVLKSFIPRLSSTHVDLLSNSSGFLTNLNQSYWELVTHKNISTVSYYEKFKTKGVFLVVSEESADPGVSGGTRPIPLDADHISICKPQSRQSLVYVSLVRHITAVLKSCTLSCGSEAFAAYDYGQKSEKDRRDLLQKLIDAGREREYQTANDLQNKFAQRYYKLGLYSEAKDRSDAILAKVEQRFITHVYNPKICRGASDDEIAEALQAHVIDPISSTSVSASVVPQALYFLTEQCFIQWDSSA